MTAAQLFDQADPDSGIFYDPASADSLMAYGLNVAIGRARDLLEDLIRTRAAMQDGDRARVVQELTDLVDLLQHERQGHHDDDLGGHFIHLARGYAYGSPEVYCCSVGIEQQEAVNDLAATFSEPDREEAPAAKA